MSELSRRALAGYARFLASLAILLFLPAWSLRFWEAWVYWGIFSASGLMITLYLLKHDPQLMERRREVGSAAEGRRSQKTIQAAAGALGLVLFVVPGLDHRLGWSDVPWPIVLLADGLVVAAFLGYFLVFRENTFAASVVRVEEGQRVISSGPYGLVRHPMYTASALLFLATPVALGSFWALAVALPLCLLIVARLLDEERLLSAELAGYDEYRRKVRYRLIPLVW